MKFQRSDVVLVPFPFSDLSTTKVRPAVVVSSALYHATEPDLLLAALTSKVATATGPFDYLLSDWRTAGLTAAPMCASAALRPFDGQALLRTDSAGRDVDGGVDSFHRDGLVRGRAAPPWA